GGVGAAARRGAGRGAARAPAHPTGACTERHDASTCPPIGISPAAIRARRADSRAFWITPRGWRGRGQAETGPGGGGTPPAASARRTAVTPAIAAGVTAGR